MNIECCMMCGKPLEHEKNVWTYGKLDLNEHKKYKYNWVLLGDSTDSPPSNALAKRKHKMGKFISKICGEYEYKLVNKSYDKNYKKKEVELLECDYCATHIEFQFTLKEVKAVLKALNTHYQSLYYDYSIREELERVKKQLRNVI